MNWLSLECDSCGDEGSFLTDYKGQALCKVCLPIAKAVEEGPCVDCGLVHSSVGC
jgi:hypothetical protein